MMEDVVIRYLERPQLDHPVLIEGLPGVGNVGKLAAEHLIEELKLRKFAELFSKYLPPQVMVGDEGRVANAGEAYRGGRAVFNLAGPVKWTDPNRGTSYIADNKTLPTRRK